MVGYRELYSVMLDFRHEAMCISIFAYTWNLIFEHTMDSKRVYHSCRRHNVIIRVYREFLSTCTNYDCEGVHIDRLATSKIRNKFRYKLYDIDCVEIDFITQKWSGCNNWIVATAYMAALAILHVIVNSRANSSSNLPSWFFLVFNFRPNGR